MPLSPLPQNAHKKDQNYSLFFFCSRNCCFIAKEELDIKMFTVALLIMAKTWKTQHTSRKE